MNSYEKWQEMIEDDTAFWKKKERNRNARKAQKKRKSECKHIINQVIGV